MQLWQHQKDVRKFARDKDGVLVWHGLGSGKSLSTCAIVDDMVPEANQFRALIICPKVCVPTWQKEFEKYGEISGTKFVICAPIKGSVKKKATLVQKFLNRKSKVENKVVILNYEAVWRPGLGATRDKHKNITDPGVLKKYKWDAIVCDEVQKLKTPGSKVSMFLSQLGKKAKKRLGLSGTPFATPLDVYAIYRFLDPDIFKTTNQRFKMRYAEWGGFEGRQVVRYINQEELSQRTHSIAHRVRSEDVIELPEHQHIFLECELSTQARKAYDRFKREAVLEFANGKELTAANILTKYLRLAQIASGTIKDDAGHSHLIDTAKIDTLRELLLSINHDEPVVIFTRFKHEVTQIKDMIGKFQRQGERPRVVAELTGDKDERKMFQSGEADTIVVNLQAGGAGVNELVRARYGIYFSTGYSSLDFEQSMGRIRRPGSDLAKTVFYYHIMAANTIDAIIANAIQKKIDLVEAVLKEFSTDCLQNAA